ncbi:alpha-mannosidase [Thermosipho ferrireducens]|uniref:Alpha-mannosidase n=1 Tax=Thermosipho ferrireducens TaxID=2571116 RepID=A0ABX7SAX0_9BACT|nr:glycoside hydrolase family 38 C-terminal domain-containing protein [Thermosipho ferrireducens]QTA38957.1 alpha-mannosidase [Thermosipho ferrireducens]
MYRGKDKEIAHLKRMLSEIYPYSILERIIYKGWNVKGKEICLPYKWSGDRILFENKFKIGDKKVYMKAWFGGESLIYIDGKPVGEINIFHTEFDLAPFCDGNSHEIKVETVPRGLFGTKEESIFKESYLIVYDEELKKALNFAYNVIQVAEFTEDIYLSKKLMKLSEEFLSSVYIPRDTEEYLKNVLDNPAIIQEVSSVWNPPELEYSLKRENKIVKTSFFKYFYKFKEEVERLDLPKYGVVNLVGHAHIDYAWLWPIDETKRKIIRTFSNSVTLLKKYREFIYTQSSAKMYKDLKESCPELFGEIKELVKEGRWEPVGGMWVEPDCNIPSGESLVRQFYYGQKFFEKEFGKKSKVCWLPDVFGFSWILPQIIKEAGMEYFITTKLYWNESNEFPYDLCRWRGIDGSEIVYYSFKNLEEGYNGKISARSIINTWENFRHKDITSSILLSFGYGDGGGGPTEEMCENYYSLKKIPGIPYIKYSTVEDFVKELPDEDIPVWDGELYLELHRGTLTSQSRIKILHKKCEDKLREVEILNTIFNENYQKEIDGLWDVVLYNEFHDILPGSSINEVYKRAEKELNEILERVKFIKNKIVNEKIKDTISIFNPSSYPQKIRFELESLLNLEYKGKKLDVQKTFDKKYIYYLDEEIEPLTFANIKINNEPARLESRPFESDSLQVKIFDDGSFNVYHKKSGKYLFKEKGNILMLYKDIPYYWDNWDIDVNYEKSGVQLKANNVKTVEEGHLRKVIKVEYKVENSKITQFYIIWKDLELVEVKTIIDWHMRKSLLKALFPTNVLSRYGKYDLDLGYIQRPTHRNTNIERAKFEVLAHRWVSIEQPDFGVSLINNGKYGHRINENIIEISLIKAGTYPDFFADEGLHEFSYAIFPAFNVKDTIKVADNFNKCITTFRKSRNQNFRVKVFSDNFKIMSFRKISGDKIVLRIGEVVGTSGKVNIECSFAKKAFVTNILEEIKREIPIRDNKITVEYEPFKIYTFMFELKDNLK